MTTDMACYYKPVKLSSLASVRCRRDEERTRIDDVAAVGSNHLSCRFPPRPWRHFQSPDLQHPALAQSHGPSTPSLVLPLLALAVFTPPLQRSASANGSSGLRQSQSRSSDTVVATGHCCLYSSGAARQCQLLSLTQSSTLTHGLIEMLPPGAKSCMQHNEASKIRSLI
ncbi:hypothetical protein V8C26DRAFT_155252 [Trichoderma gracile]